MSNVCKMHWFIEEDDEGFREFHAATLAWVRSLGLDPERLAPRAAVVWHGEGYELHVDQIVRDEQGRGDRWDPLDMDDLLKIRKVVPVDANSWPKRPVITDGLVA